MNNPSDPLSLQPAAPGAPQPAPTPGPEAVEDSGSQALSEALRSSFLVVKVLMFGVVIYFLCSGIFTVGPDEKAMILRFGKPVGEGEKALLASGLHFAFPEPIDEVVRIPIKKVQTVNSTIGWYATTALQKAAKNEPPPKPSLNPATDGYLLTADRNILHIQGALRYRISEPGLHYAFQFAEASNLVQNAFNNALLYASSRYKIDDILTAEVAGFREVVRRRLEQLIDEQQLGVVVDQIELQAIPPRQLTDDFNKVLLESIQSTKAINEARQYANQKISQAQAEYQARLNNSQSERDRLVDFVAAEAKRFTALLPAYRSSPELFIQQQRTDVYKRVLAGVQDIWVLPRESGGRAPELRLQMNRETPKPKPAPPAPAKTDDHGGH